MSFTEEESKILSNYVTDVGGDIFAIKNLPGVVGAVYARYSRAKTGFQETLLREFVQAGMLNEKKADELIERVLVAYGDDSVGELEGAHVSFENISVLATKEIEDRRIGGSPIEKSTRYVFFDEKDGEGNYKYIRDPKIMASRLAGEYVETMDFIFDTYKELIEPMQQFYAELFPIEKAEYDVLGTGQKQKLDSLTDEKDHKAFRTTHKIDLKTKACDTLRCLLPLATKTNVGLYGNGRFFQTLISHLLSTSYPEVVSIGEKTLQELGKIIPQYVRRSKPKKYNKAIDDKMKALASDLMRGIVPQSNVPPAQLMPLNQVIQEEFLLTHMLYGYTLHSFEQIYSLVKTFDEKMKDIIKSTYVGTRETRRDRPGRALEAGYRYTFDLCTDFGTYKDLMRHRMTTQIRQRFTPYLGMVVPSDLQDAGLQDKVLVCHEKVLALYKKIEAELGGVARYLVLHGHKVRFIMGMNDREAMHLLELRTTKQGHPQYRKLCQQMHEAIKKVDPWRASLMNFVDHDSYDSARGDSEARQRVKEKMLEEKFKDS